MRQLLLVLALSVAACGSASSDTNSPATALAGKMSEIDVSALHDRLSRPGAVLIDVRTDAEWQEGHVPGAIHIPLDDVAAAQAQIATLSKDEPIYFVCRTGRRSGIASERLAKAGYTTVNVAGGTKGWIEAGYDVDVPSATQKPE